MSHVSLQIIYASGSGHTEHVVTTLVSFLSDKGFEDVKVKRAEECEADDLLKGDVLLLGSGTWNTGSVEGQLHPYMHELLKKKAVDIDLKQKKCAFISLGDERYYYTARATEHFQQFLRDHGGELCLEPLLVINEPFGQEEKVEKWGEKLLTILQS